MRRAAPFLALVTVLLVASCATLSEEECRGGNWRAIGIFDGMAGRSAGYVSNHAEACAELGITPDFAAWRAGREEGLGSYCTPERAYSAGLSGNRLSPVCGAFDPRPLAAANYAGLRRREVNRDIEQVRDQIRAADWRIDELRDGDTSKADRAEIRRLRRDIDRWRRELYRLDYERGFGPPWY